MMSPEELVRDLLDHPGCLVPHEVREAIIAAYNCPEAFTSSGVIIDHYTLDLNTGLRTPIDAEHRVLWHFHPSDALLKRIGVDAAPREHGETEKRSVLISPPKPGDHKDACRFMRELAEVLLDRHARRFKLYDLKDATLWIFKKPHAPDDPYRAECKMAEEIRKGGRKEKLPIKMYTDYVLKGKVSNPTIKALEAKRTAKLNHERDIRELAEIGKEDPNYVTPASYD